MRILHYSLGFPPYRSGGLTKFCVDLMKQQVAQGHEVSLLWPGQMIAGEVRIKHKATVDGVFSYEMINPLPISFDEGIVEIEAFVKIGKLEVFKRFLNELQPDVIHIHTLMGLYYNFVLAAKQLDKKIVFTAHDFFPICPKVTMFRDGTICNSVQNLEKCPQCNATALNLRKIRILQSAPYRMLKDSRFVKSLRKKHRDRYLNEERKEQSVILRGSDDYKRLRDYYWKMLESMDAIHFNSTITKEVYDNLFSIKKSLIIPITHTSVEDHRKIKKYSCDHLRIRYLGPQGEGKGFFLLKEALDKLWNERQDFSLDIHFQPVQPSIYMKSHDRYSYNELEQIFEQTDILIAPSVWYETFGYTVIEALSFGVPVIISGTVGAKDILVDGAGIVIDEIDSEKLYKTIKDLTVEKLKLMNKTIVDHQPILTIMEMSERIMKEFYLEV